MNEAYEKRNAMYCSQQHGESEYNVIGRIGGDANLSARGQQYARALAEYINAIASREPLSVWTSELRRTKQTAAEIRAPKRAVRALNELDAVSIFSFRIQKVPIKALRRYFHLYMQITW